jgi:hypothetical protein
MRTTFKITILLIILGCSTKDKPILENTKSPGIQVLDNKSKQNKVEILLLTNVITHHFSSSTSKDTFKIRLIGKTITESKFEFEIKTSHGLVIHFETYPSYYLVGYGLDPNANEIEQSEYIGGRISKFFDEENFRQPAISKDELFDEDYSNKEIWDDIKSDSTSVKFAYLIGEEGNGQIAYSKKLKKVVTIFSCC